MQKAGFLITRLIRDEGDGSVTLNKVVLTNRKCLKIMPWKLQTVCNLLEQSDLGLCTVCLYKSVLKQITESKCFQNTNERKNSLNVTHKDNHDVIVFNDTHRVS